jgi:hypothetical protein
MHWGRVGGRCAGLAAAGAATLAFTGVASAAAQPVIRVAPMSIQNGGRVNPLIPHGSTGNDTVTSSNWAGYAVQAASQFTDVKGSWVQPAVTCNTPSAQYAAFWAGIDGYSSNSVEQLGTDSDCTGRNRPSYYAWYEMYPAYSVNISTTKYPVKPGDAMSAEVSVSGTTFTLSMSDATERWSFSTTQSGSGLAQSSAELIAESPEICNHSCKLAQLSDFGTVNFTGSQAALAGGTDEPFSSFTADNGPHDIIATTSAGQVRAQPSALSAAGTAFSIAWEHN